jgi:RNA polymerase sporulation-specific sigma factor
MRENGTFLWWVRLWMIRVLKRFNIPSHIYYLGNHEALPPPLTSDEEISLLNKLEAGDVSVRNSLIERNLRLVVYIARKFENTGIGIEDLVSIGTIGLIKAVNTFKPHPL